MQKTKDCIGHVSPNIQKVVINVRRVQNQSILQLSGVLSCSKHYKFDHKRKNCNYDVDFTAIADLIVCFHRFHFFMAKTKTKLYSEKEFKMHDVGFTLAPTGNIYFVSSCHIDIIESTPAKA
jgi:hypothetical protein